MMALRFVRQSLAPRQLLICCKCRTWAGGTRSSRGRIIAPAQVQQPATSTKYYGGFGISMVNNNIRVVHHQLQGAASTSTEPSSSGSRDRTTTDFKELVNYVVYYRFLF
jgi:hypothetical protein